VDLELTDCLFAEAGPEVAAHVLRGEMHLTFERPLLAPLVRGALAIFGRDPGRILRWAPKAWALLFRGMGSLRVESDKASARVSFAGLPPEVAASENWLRGVAGSLASVFDLLEIEGESHLVQHGDGCAEYQLSWPGPGEA